MGWNSLTIFIAFSSDFRVNNFLDIVLPLTRVDLGVTVLCRMNKRLMFIISSWFVHSFIQPSWKFDHESNKVCLHSVKTILKEPSLMFFHRLIKLEEFPSFIFVSINKQAFLKKISPSLLNLYAKSLNCSQKRTQIRPNNKMNNILKGSPRVRKNA